MVLSILSSLGCRNSQEEAAANEKALKAIDSIEVEVVNTQQKLDQTSKALENAIKDLDSI